MGQSARITRDLGAFAANLEFDQIPEAAIRTVISGFTDCVGVLLAGHRDAGIGPLKEILSVRPPGGEARIALGGVRTAVSTAAFIGGTAAHILDYDDVSLDGHPSAVLVPAILAQGDAVAASGRDVITAYVAGYEVWADLWSREPGFVHNKGWHPTAVYGAIASAAACSRLRRLNSGQTANAIAIAASFAGGLVSNFGSSTKSLQVGRASESGVLAAGLAAAGATGAMDALEHPQGFLRAVSPSGDVDDRTPVSASALRIMQWGLNLKRYPMCYCIHRASDSLLDLTRRHEIDASWIDRIEVFVGETALKILRVTSPSTPLEAKFSAEFAMAAGLAARSIGLGQFNETFLASPAVQSLLPKVIRRRLPDAGGSVPQATADWVEITMHSGERLQGVEVEHASGSFEKPMTQDQLWEKFAECTSFLSADGRTRLFESLEGLDRLDSIQRLRIP
jgi:2-methylcitrate dehydratase PrpD